MTYHELNLIFVGAALVFFIVAMLSIGMMMRRSARSRRASAAALGTTSTQEAAPANVRVPGRTRSALLAKYVITFLLVAALTAIFDNVIIGLGIVAYHPDALSGVYLGLIPIEDFAYSLAVVLVAPTLWGLLGHARARHREDTSQ